MKIIILDFTEGEVHVFPYDENVFNDAEEWFEHPHYNTMDLNINGCQYMVVKDLTINIH